jgi:hypothetical protein
MAIALQEHGVPHFGGVGVLNRRPVPQSRVAVRCPDTGFAVFTGLGLSAVPSVNGSQVLTECMACGQDHAWRIEDAFLA